MLSKKEYGAWNKACERMDSMFCEFIRQLSRTLKTKEDEIEKFEKRCLELDVKFDKIEEKLDLLIESKEIEE